MSQISDGMEIFELFDEFGSIPLRPNLVFDPPRQYLLCVFCVISLERLKIVPTALRALREITFSARQRKL